METNDNHQHPTYHDDGISNTHFNMKDVKAYTIRPSGPADGHEGWMVEVRFHEEKPDHRILGPTPKDVLDKLMKLFP